MRASRTLKILEADAVYDAESNSALSANVSLMLSSGVCVVGMYENTQPRNLGDPDHSQLGKFIQSCLREYADDEQEVRWLHSTEEAE
jgi:hypothetical protein